MLLSDLFPLPELDRAIRDLRHVRVQSHPDDPDLRIYNYADTCAFERAWTPVTLACRGLIVSHHGPELVVVARPWDKFFNHGEVGAPAFDTFEPVEVTDKMDGSLGILYPAPDGDWAIATRGSFASEQAIRGTRILRERYLPRWTPEPGSTHLFEIVYPENRIVCDYGAMEDLVLLGGRVNAWGVNIGPREIDSWPGPRTEVFGYRNLTEALCAPSREGAEGLVVTSQITGAKVKLKQADYVRLHAILTNTSNRRIWEHLAVHACADVVTDPKHWGTYLRLDPAVAEGVLAAGTDWQDTLIDGVPDEFHDWVRATIATIESDAAAHAAAVRALVAEVGALPRREAFERVKDHPAVTVVMGGVFGNPDVFADRLRTYAWEQARPDVIDLPFAQRAAA